MQGDTHLAECQIAELTHRVLHACGDDKVLRLVVLQNQPHTLHIVFGIAPIAQRRQVAEVEFVLLALCDTRRSEGNLARYEGLATTLRLVVEQYARTAEHIVCLAIFLYNPIAIEFRHSVGRIGVERCVLVLRHLLHLAVKFRCGGLVDTTCACQPASADSLQHTQNTSCIDVCRELRRVETDLHMRLRSQVVNLVGTHLADDLYQSHRVRQIAIVEVKMRFAFEVGDTLAIVHRTAADDTMYVISFLQQELAQVRAVLPRDTGD